MNASRGGRIVLQGRRPVVLAFLVASAMVSALLLFDFLPKLGEAGRNLQVMRVNGLFSQGLANDGEHIYFSHRGMLFKPTRATG